MGIKKIVLSLTLLVSLIGSAYAKLTIATYNIRNFDYDVRSNTPTNKSHLRETLQQINADLLAVQEINQKFIFNKFIKSNFSEHEVALTDCGGSHDQKLGFVFNTKKLKLIGFEENLKIVDPSDPSNTSCEGSRPLAIAHFKMLDSNEELIAMAVHLKSGGQRKSINKRFMQLKVLTEAVQKYKSLGFKNFIIMGDFNSTQYTFKGVEYDKFNSLVSKMGMVDLTKSIPCTSYWWGGRSDGKQHPSVLDHVLVSESLAFNKIAKTASPLTHCQKLRCETTDERDMGISFDEVSDHCPVVSEID